MQAASTHERLPTHTIKSLTDAALELVSFVVYELVYRGCLAV